MMGNKASVERCDNGWLLTYYTRTRSDITEHREVYPVAVDLMHRLVELFAPTLQPANPVDQQTGD